MIEVVFWSCIMFILYAYLGYPVLLWLISLFREKSVKKGNITPSVSFIITAHNEEKGIQGKIENTLKQDYPRKHLEIIVASDCSTDRTDEIVNGYQAEGVILVRARERKGKENAQKRALDISSGNIIIFSDVGTIIPPNGISNIVKNFYDPTVGCVSSVDKFLDRDGTISGEGAYVRYEMLLRRLETKVNSLVGLSGSFFAARREVCQTWTVNLQSDFITLLNAVKMGLRGVSDFESIGYYKNITDEINESERKVRTVLRGMAVLMKNMSMLNLFRYGLFSWQLFSHKLCRWLVPFAAIVVFLSNGALAFQVAFYLYILSLQIIFYAVAFGGIWAKLRSKEFILILPSFFVEANVSVLQAWYRYAQGKRMITWTPSAR